MNSLSLMLAWRYLRGTTREKNISTMVKVCFFGIFIGTFALALTVAVMEGIQQTTHKKMQGIHSQIILRGYGNSLAFQEIASILEHEFPQVQAFAPSDSKQVILQNPETEEGNEVLVIKGIDPVREGQVSIIERKLVDTGDTERSLESVLTDHQILIGAKTAENLGLSVGDTVNLLFTTGEHAGKKIALESSPVLIGGIFQTGLEDYDAGVVFCSLELLQELFPESGITQIGITLTPHASEKHTIQALRERLGGIEVYSWKDLYPALVSALKLEKYAMFLILALITLVATMNIVSLLFMQITQKRGDIAILQAMGCPAQIVSRIFIWMGLLIACSASLLGLLAAAMASWFLETYPFISLPDVYYVSHLPAHMDASIFISVFIVTMLLAGIATWLPARRTWRINVADTLRSEA